MYLEKCLAGVRISNDSFNKKFESLLTKQAKSGRNYFYDIDAEVDVVAEVDCIACPLYARIARSDCSVGLARMAAESAAGAYIAQNCPRRKRGSYSLIKKIEKEFPKYPPKYPK